MNLLWSVSPKLFTIWRVECIFYLYLLQQVVFWLQCPFAFPWAFGKVWQYRAGFDQSDLLTSLASNFLGSFCEPSTPSIWQVWWLKLRRSRQCKRPSAEAGSLHLEDTPRLSGGQGQPDGKFRLRSNPESSRGNFGEFVIRLVGKLESGFLQENNNLSTSVIINDPLGQTTVPPVVIIIFTRHSFSCAIFWKVGMDEICAKIIITTGRVCGSAEWIKNMQKCNTFADSLYATEKDITVCIRI